MAPAYLPGTPGTRRYRGNAGKFRPALSGTINEVLFLDPDHVDVDGKPEAMLGGQDGRLLVVGDGGDRGEVVWTKPFDGPVGTPLLADLDGDGRVEVAVSVGDGHIYVLGP